MKRKIFYQKSAAIFFALFLLLGLSGCQDRVSLSKDFSTDINQEAPAGKLTVHYIDVGQGDATLITCGEDAMLIDAGDNSKGTALQSYLLSQDITELDYVIGTHPDADHIGGLDVVITKFDCGTILLTGEEKDTKTYDDVVSAM